MGLSPSILPIASSRELIGKSRWPPRLQNVSLEKLGTWYTIFRELGAQGVTPRHIAFILEVSEADMMCVAEMWQVGRDDAINVMELLTLMAATSTSLSLRTKLTFFFRMWDVDHDKKLHSAEMAFLLRGLVYSLANYCSCERSLIPDSKKISKYVEKSFKTMTSEDMFISWAMRHRLLRSTLTVFSYPKGKGSVDMLDFVLSGPKGGGPKQKEKGRRSQAELKRSGTRHGGGAVSGSGLFGDSEGDTDSDFSDDPLSPKFKKQGSVQFVDTGEVEKPMGRAPTLTGRPSVTSNFAMPTVGEDEDEGDQDGEESELFANDRENFNFTGNAPANMQAQSVILGRLNTLEALACWADVRHTCPLHEEDCMHCMYLSKHEVLLSYRIWHFIKENRDCEFKAAQGLLDMLKMEVRDHSSILVQTEHRNIFRLMDTKTNRIYKGALRRIRRGLRVTFTEFLHAVCPCASQARLRLFEFWHVQLHWAQEERSVMVMKQWRRDFESTKTESEVQLIREAVSVADSGDGDLIVTVDDLVVGVVVSKDVAEEVMRNRDLTIESEINEKEFLQWFCDSKWAASGSTFVELQRKKFDRLAAGKGKIRTPKVTVAEPSFGALIRKNSKDSSCADDTEGFPLEELIGDADILDGFDFLDALDDEEYTAEVGSNITSSLSEITPQLLQAK